MVTNGAKELLAACLWPLYFIVGVAKSHFPALTTTRKYVRLPIKHTFPRLLDWKWHVDSKNAQWKCMICKSRERCLCVAEKQERKVVDHFN
jgi:hypothetical protein